MSDRIPLSTAFTLVFKGYLSSDHISDATGKTVTCAISKNVGAFGAPSGGATATEIGNGWYYIAISTTDTNAAGPLIFRATASGMDSSEKDYLVVDPATVFYGVNVVSQANIDFGALQKTSLNAATPASVQNISAQTGDAYARLGATPPTAVQIRTEMDSNSTKLANLDATISSRTKPADTQAAVTTVTTTTNLTNAPTNGDFTAAMKTSLNNATPVASLSGDFTATMKTSLNASTPASIQNQVAQTVDVATRLSAAAYVAPDNTDILAILAVKAVTDKLITAMELNAGNYRFTIAALAQAPAGGGGGGLNAQQVANAVWDELIANHLTAGTTGRKLSDLSSSAGSGAITWTYTLTDSVSGNPIANAEIWITTDALGNNVIASGMTNQAGAATFYLNAGVVYVWRQKSGWNFVNPDTETVS
jgi:hypothetical protein